MNAWIHRISEKLQKLQVLRQQLVHLWGSGNRNIRLGVKTTFEEPPEHEKMEIERAYIHISINHQFTSLLHCAEAPFVYTIVYENSTVQFEKLPFSLKLQTAIKIKCIFWKI
jgi:hypothetical protein